MIEKPPVVGETCLGFKKSATVRTVALLHTASLFEHRDEESPVDHATWKVHSTIFFMGLFKKFEYVHTSPTS